MIIAISEYNPSSGLSPLPFCRNDGEAVYEALKSQYEVLDKYRLIGKVQGKRMKEAIFEFFRKSVDSNDTLLFYYSGHGVPDSFGDHFLASSDVDTNIPDEYGYNFLEIETITRKTPARNVIAIIDCCFSGAAELGKGDSEQAVRARGKMERIFEEGNGRCILASSLGGQMSYNMDGSEYSRFTHFLLEGLKGAKGNSVNDGGIVTPTTLSNYIYNSIPLLNQQKPITRIAMSGDIAIVKIPSLAKNKSSGRDLLIKLLMEGDTDAFDKESANYREESELVANPKGYLPTKGRRSYRIRLDGVDLSNNRLKDVNLYNVDLSRSQLASSDFSGSNFERASLVGSRAKNAVFRDAKFMYSDLEDLILSGASLERANFEAANMPKADLSYSSMIGALLPGANLSRSNLSYADLTNAQLPYANLTEANLTSTILRSANLEGTTLHMANLAGADLSRAQLPKINAMSADLSHTNFSYADLSNARLSNAKFSSSQLHADSPERVSSWPVIFANANLSGAELSSIDLSDADLSNAIILGCDEYSNLRCKNADLRNAVIDNPALVEHFIANGAFSTPEAVKTLEELRIKLKNLGYSEERIAQLVLESKFGPKSPVRR